MRVSTILSTLAPLPFRGCPPPPKPGRPLTRPTRSRSSPAIPTASGISVDTISPLMPGFEGRMMEGVEAVEFQNANPANRYAMEGMRDDRAAQAINRQAKTLSAVDIWADRRCETTPPYAIMH